MKILVPAILLLLSSTICPAQNPSAEVAGDWVFILETQGERFTRRAQLSLKDRKMEGKTGNNLIRGSINGSAVELEWVRESGQVEVTMTGKYENGRLSGTARPPDGLIYTWSAERERKIEAVRRGE